MEALFYLDKPASYNEINRAFVGDYAERTFKRDLPDFGYLSVSGRSRSTEYQITLFGRLCLPVEANEYVTIDPSARVGVKENYQFDLWDLWAKTLFRLMKILC